MRRDKLFGNMFMRLSACALMALACAGEAWGIGNTISKPRLNPVFVKWHRERKNPKPQANNSSVTNIQKKSTRLLASTPEADTDLLPLPEGLVPTMIDFSYLNSLNSIDARSVSGALPACYDPRNKGLTPVRHQDPQDTGIGTCWAQASIGSMETWLKLNGHGLNQFSVKNMVNREGWDSNSWYGGNFIRSSAYLLRWNGPVRESDDPYTNKNGIVNYSLSSPVLPPAYHVQQTRLVPARTGALDNDSLKRAILEFGGLYATMKLYTPYYQGTSRLVPYWNNTGAYYCPETGAGHAVTLIGWDDNYSKDNFNSDYRPKGNGAWIVKDSYGEDLPRDNGYIYVSYYDTTFAYTTSCAFPLIEGNDNYGYVYQYDEFGQVIEWGIPSNSTQIYTSGYGANMFTATQAEELSAVGFYATIPKVTYKIRIYTGCDASKPSSGTLALEQSGTADDYAGFYTIPLRNTITVGKDSRFSVVVFLSTPGAAPLSLEIAVDGYTSNAIANAGESFFSLDGSNWYDFNPNANLTYGIPANFCCKAYTKSATLSKPTLSSIAISGVSSLTAGQAATFTCEATYSDGSKKMVSPTWSITEGRNYATISSAGLVTAKSVTTQQRVTVKASYTEDGVTKDATWGFYVTIAAPGAPTGVTASQGTETSCIRVNWTAPSGATEYAVYRATANNSKNAQYLENVTVARYNDTSTTSGVDYWYFIKAKNSSGTSGFSTGANGWRKLLPPESVAASDTLLDKVEVSWSEVEGAMHYRVYRAESIDGNKSALSGWQTATSYNDTTAKTGVAYYYFVVAATDASGSRPSDYSIVEDGMMASPVTVDYLEIKGDANIASGGYADYTADAIYTDRHRVENVSPVTWTVSGDGATVSGNRVTAATVTENKKVVLLASYTEDGEIARGEKQITITAVKPAAPRNVVANVTETGVTVAWSAVAGAATYKVYRDGVALGLVRQGTSCPDTTAMPGVAYVYAVSAVNSAGESDLSAGVEATVPLAAPTGVTATDDRTDGVLVSWRGVNGATYYRVSRATSENGAKTELGTWTTDASFLDTSAVAGVTYCYFVRAATSSGGANASEYSSPATIGRRIPSRTLLSIEISGMDKVAASKSAVYTCVAKYSDETTETVTPTWSASPTSAATINENGLLTAKAVVSNTKVTVTASFGEKTDAMEVTIVAPAGASASVSNVRVKPRWPFSPLVDIDYTLTTSPDGTFARVSLSCLDNDHNLPLVARTLTGDGASGVVAAGERRITWDVGADCPNLHVTSLDVVLDAMPCVIAVPANFTASAGTSSYAVELTWDVVSDATGYEIWRSVSPSAANASNIVIVAEGTTYSDTDANAMQPYFYWVKTVTEYGTSDFGEYAYGYRLPHASGTVMLDPNGGAVSETSLSYTVGTAYGTFPRATRSGYNFVGWFTAKDGGTEVSADTIATDSISTLYAHWSPCEYFVRFNANGGAGTMADMSVYHGVTTNLPANAFSRDGCSFSGWATNSDDVVVYADGAGITPASDMTLYAVWGYSAPWNVVVTTEMPKEITIAWAAATGATSYQVMRNTSSDYSTAMHVATVTGTNYIDSVGNYTTEYYYWIVALNGSSAAVSAAAIATRAVDLLPIRNLLNLLDFSAKGDRDGYLDDIEIEAAMRNPNIADLDGDPSKFSAEELSIFTRIQTLNTDKELISAVMRGNFSAISDDAMEELASISYDLKELTKRRDGRPYQVAATQSDYSSPQITISWSASSRGVYNVWRTQSNDYTGNATRIAQVTNVLTYVDESVSFRQAYSYKISAVFSDGSEILSTGYAYGYWGDWCWEDVDDGNIVDVLPLRNLLNLLDFAAGANRNGYLDDNELNRGMRIPSLADLDGDSGAISDEEMSIFLRIQLLNTDKELISSIMRGNFDYRGMTLAHAREICSLSDEIKELTKNRN